MSYIIFDQETTGLLVPDGTPVEMQPKAIEFAAIKTDDKFNEIARIEFMCNPGFPLSDIIKKITGITDDDLKDKPPFSANMKDLCDFFLGTEFLIAHNITFDIGILKYELMRLGRLTSFPWPPRQICTIEKSFHINGYRLNLTKLYKLATGKDQIEGAHRAMRDVEALVDCVRWMRTQGML